MSEDKKKKKSLLSKTLDEPEMTDTMLEMKAIPFFIDSSGKNQRTLDMDVAPEDEDVADFEDQDDTVRIEAEDEDHTAADFLDESQD